MEHCLLEKTPRRDRSPNVAVEEQPDDGPNRTSGLFCARCRQWITDEESRITVDGAHDHTFANPSGSIFRIGCFSRAPGAVTHPTETTEFTWFPGFAWSVCGCMGCGAHLGWRFSKPDDRFFGLIVDRLVENTWARH